MKIIKSHEAPSVPGFLHQWPFKDMDVGDMVEFDAREDADKIGNARVYAHVYASKTGRKFKTRKTDSGGLRVWRVE